MSTRHTPAKHTALERRTLLVLAVVALAFSIVTGYAVHRSREAKRSGVRPFQLDAHWIRTAGQPSHSGYFRKSIRLAGNVRHAWLVVAARDGFEVTVNGNPLSRLYLWRPTRPFQNGLSEPGQRVTSETPALALNFPREYQWDGHDNYRLPVFIDIARELRAGVNVICVEVESRRAPASMCLRGEIMMWSGQRFAFESDESWRAAAVPPGLQRVDWTQPNYLDSDWSTAVTTTRATGQMYRTVPPRLFTRPFDAQWIRHPHAGSRDAVCFETIWSIPQTPDEAWLRVATNRHFDLTINGQPVRVSSQRGGQLDHGHWILGRRRAWNLTASPELLDPDEVGSLYAGNRFESPRHGDPTADELAATENVANRTRDKPRATNRSNMPGTYDPRRSLAETRRTPDKPYAFPEQSPPKSLTRDRAVGGLLAYDVSNLLRKGDNTIRIQVSRPLHVDPLGWPAQVAVDGEATFRGGGEVVTLRSDAGWHGLTRDDAAGTAAEAVVVRPMNRPGLVRPRLEYRGVALAAGDWFGGWPTWVLLSASLTCATVSLVLGIMFLVFREAGGTPGYAAGGINETAHVLIGVLFAPLTALLTALLWESSLQERHEMLWFTQPRTWCLIFGLATAVGVLTAVVDLLGRLGLKRMRSRGHFLEFAIRRLPKTQLWRFTILWLLLLCGFLRAYKLDFQPLDDDEYASTQAILAIAETGAPQFVPEGVWYTRSPLFHYLAGGIAYVCGANLWTLRLPAVAFGVATAGLAYLCGSRLLKNPWVGMGTLFLLTIHPFEIYTGHIIRFYQMQQFFALLTVYCFCKGFVSGQSQGYRYATIGVFLAAILSQEISAVMAVPLAIGYFLFARDKGWAANTRLLCVAACALAMIVIDYAAFQTRCLTRVEGVSASLEAAVKPHFWHPYNFLALYVGYSRLHVLLSVFLLLGLPFTWHERSRNAIALHFMLLGGVLMTNLLVTHVSFRYQYWLIPIWVLLSLDGLRALLTKVCRAAYNPFVNRNRHMCALALSTSVIFAGVVLSWSPWRIPGSYDHKILGDSTGACRYVRSQLRDGDAVAVTEPHTHATLLEVGHVDYDISVPLLYDFAVLKDGRLIDRNGGAEVVSSLQQFQQICASHQRVWVLLNREKFRSRGKNLRWEYPGARFELFIRQNCELKHRTYLWSVYLWDHSQGFHVPFRDGGA